MQTIHEFINSYKTKDRDTKVLEEINKFNRNNTRELNDGIIKYPIKIGANKKEQFLAPYNIPKMDFDKFYKTNKVLKKGFETIKDRTKLCLLISYKDTKDIAYLVMLALIEYGSKFSRHFKYGVSNPEKMKSVINNLSDKFLIKKYGSIYKTLLEQMKTIIKTPKLKKQWDRFNDEDVLHLINRIATTIGSMVKNVATVYYETETGNDVVYLQSETMGDDTVFLVNNSIIIGNLKTIIENMHPTGLDQKIFPLINVSKLYVKYIMTKILLDGEKDYFKKLSFKYIDYYVLKEGSDIKKMEKNFLSFSMKARLNDKELNKINDDIYEDIVNHYNVYNTNKEAKPLTASEILKIVQDIKKYVLLKVTNILINDMN